MRKFRSARQWAPRQTWDTAPGGPFPFRIVCPACGVEADVAAVGFRMTVTLPGPPPPAGVNA